MERALDYRAANCCALQRFLGDGAFAIDGAVQTLSPGATIDVALLPNGVDPYLIPIPHPRLEVTLPNTKRAM